MLYKWPFSKRYSKKEIKEMLGKYVDVDPLPIKLPYNIEIEGIKENNLYYEDYLYPKYNKLNKARIFDINTRSAKVLDLGFGSGCIPIYFLKKGFKVTAVSINKTSIARMEAVKNICNLKNLTIVESDITAMFSFEKIAPYMKRLESFDLILLLGVIHHLKEDDWLPLLNKCYYSLKPNGVIVIETKGHVPCLELLKDTGFKEYKLMHTTWHRAVYRGLR